MPNTIGGKTIRLKEAVSTNDLCLELISSGAEHGTVVIADKQSKGKGRLGRTWISPEGGLYLSVILKEGIEEEHCHFLTFALCLSAADAIRSVSGSAPRIKWPNDILIKGRKVAGVLVEKHGRDYIAGIGVNINNGPESFPEEIRGKATSLLVESGSVVDRDRFIMKMLERFECRLKTMSGEGRQALLEEIRDLSCTVGKQVVVENDGKKLEGTARDIDGSGALIIESDGGKITLITSGEIYFGD